MMDSGENVKKLERAIWDLEASIKRENTLQAEIDDIKKDYGKRLDTIERTLFKANIIGWFGISMMTVMGGALAWVVSNIDNLTKIFAGR
jgi:hypothetical protein